MSIFDRTFHPDEANQAFTTGRLLETGVYRYDHKDHHGPTLYYAAATIQKAAGNNSLAALDSTLLRCTPLAFSLMALAFSFLALSKIFKKIPAGRFLAATFVLILATSPIFAFFATDFIQEMLLAAFTAMMFWAATGFIFSISDRKCVCASSPKIKPGTWALLFGIASGLAFATKETSIITFAAASIAIFFTYIYNRLSSHASLSHSQSVQAGLQLPVILGIAGFVLTSTLLFSSFASHWQGVYSAFVEAPLSYIHRATGATVSEGALYHVHPWWKYANWLFSGNIALSAFIGFGTLAGLSAIALDRFKSNIPAHLKTSFAALLSFTLFLAISYSLIPYKTPWCALQMHIPLLLTGFLGFVLFSSRAIAGRFIMYSFLAMLLCNNASSLKNMWNDPDSKQIPYNYASASPQVKEMARLIEEAVSVPQVGAQSFVAVALPSEDTWPLPFYLRKLNAQIGYWTQFEELEVLATLGRKPIAVVVPAEQGHLVQPLFPHLKNTKRFEMRHKVRIRVFW
jgi:hypothetical protein